MREVVTRKYIISFSGGLGSFLAAYISKQLGHECELVFCDTLIEDEDLYRFIDEAAQKLDLPLIKLQDGRTPWQVFEDCRFIGNSRIAPCSKELKINVFRQYLVKHYAPKDCVIILGFSANELHRLQRAENNWLPYHVHSPIKNMLFYKTEALNVLKALNIKIPRLYDLGFEHNNCGGFCVRAGTAQFRKLYKNFPERYKQHAEQEDRLLKQIPTTRPFLRKSLNGNVKYLSLKQFESEADSNQIDLDFGGCGCFDENGPQ